MGSAPLPQGLRAKNRSTVDRPVCGRDPIQVCKASKFANRWIANVRLQQEGNESMMSQNAYSI